MARESSCLESARGLFGSSRALAAPCASARLPACWSRERRWLTRRCASRRQPRCDTLPCTAPPEAVTRLQVTMPYRHHVLHLRYCTRKRPQCVCSENPQRRAESAAAGARGSAPDRTQRHGRLSLDETPKARCRRPRSVQRSGDVAALLHRTAPSLARRPTNGRPACPPAVREALTTTGDDTANHAARPPLHRVAIESGDALLRCK